MTRRIAVTGTTEQMLEQIGDALATYDRVRFRVTKPDGTTRSLGETSRRSRRENTAREAVDRVDRIGRVAAKANRLAAEGAIRAAVDDGRIPVGTRERWLTLAERDPDAVCETLAEFAPDPNIAHENRHPTSAVNADAERQQISRWFGLDIEAVP